MSETPDWIHPGAQVGVMALGGHGAPTVRQVARLTQTRVVLDGRADDWFRRDTLERRQGGSWGTTYRLVPLTDTAFVKALRRSQIQSHVLRLSLEHGRWDRPNPTREQVGGALRHARRLVRALEAELDAAS